jgi:hypothetical protein
MAAKRPVKPNPTWTRWAGWLGRDPVRGTIYKDVVDMMAARQIWEGFNAVVGRAPEEARKYGTFHSWFHASYIRSQGLAIRRQVEVRNDVVSLGRLLDRIAKAPGVLSRDRFLAELHRDDHRLGNEFFDALTSPEAKAIDPQAPRADLRQLRHDTRRIKVWVDKEVAHYDPKTGTFSQGLTFGDIHRAIDVILETMNRYMQLIQGTTIAGSVSMPPWPAVFRVAWLPDDSAWREVMEAIAESENRRLGG